MKNYVEVYTSKTCNPCKMLKGYLAKENYKEDRVIYKDIVEYSEDVVQHDITKVPTIILFQDDEEKNTRTYVKITDTVPVLFKNIKNHLEE